MTTVQFDRDSMARWYAKSHLETDPGVISIHYLPTNADEREIRFVEVNELMGERTDESLEPIDFGVDMSSESAHHLVVVDVTPEQWDRITSGVLSLPHGWSLDGAVSFSA